MREVQSERCCIGRCTGEYSLGREYRCHDGYAQMGSKLAVARIQTVFFEFSRRCMDCVSGFHGHGVSGVLREFPSIRVGLVGVLVGRHLQPDIVAWLKPSCRV